MQTQSLGHTGIQVSSLCLGAMYFGTRNDQATSYRILDAYVDAGGTFIDTANIYAHWVPGFKGGESETLLNQWLKQRGNRAKLFIASKVGFGYPGVPVGLKASQIEEECNKSLKRMGIETIDLYYAHVDDRTTPLEETMGAFDKLVKAGKVRFIGGSNYRAWRLEEARWTAQTHDWAQFCCIQQHYTYLKLRPGTDVAPQVMANEDLIDYCKSTGTTLLAYSVLQSGAYTRAERKFSPKLVSADNEKRLAALRNVAAESHATVNQVILRWMLQSSPSVIPLIAASDETQLQENIAALSLQLSPDQMEVLNNAGLQ
ncbi:MAG: aldo/keto reductase [Anaerolineae bacterium]|nr:aldo/keto reductase [Anaerolineae bacterium]